MSNLKQSFKCSNHRSLFFQYFPGEGTPVVFLNGLDDSMDIWRSVTHLLSLSQPRLYVDLLGQGDSLHAELKSDLSSNYRLTAEEQGLCLFELLESLQIPRCSLVGNSYGGAIALWMAC
ncbi:MAG: alpha/beta hydrolase, partial [Bdellovibrio sp.]